MSADFKHWYLYIREDDIRVEKKQCEDEGKDISNLTDDFEHVLSLNLENLANQKAAEALFDKTFQAPIKKDYPFIEPSDLEGIKKERPLQINLNRFDVSDKNLFLKVYMAWMGRVCGCLLGKPVEGWQRQRQWGLLKDTGKFPLSEYFSIKVPKHIKKKYQLNPKAPFIEKVKCMVEDDDTNYTVIGLEIMKKYGKDFTPTDVSSYWMDHLPILRTATAERLAYRNLCLLIPPPLSASLRNPYREWIGAQIRADFFGYAAAGNPELAAEFAFRDACISHVKNGIYGEMWAAAMIAASFVCNDIKTIIKVGLSQIPKNCRLAKYINEVIKWYEDGMSYDETVENIHKMWDENFSHDLVHTISNAMIVTIALLWGEGNFEKSICMAVQAAFDTDCNGATVGSIVGAITGADYIPKKWTEPIKDKLMTGISGLSKIKIIDAAKQTMKIIEKLN